MDDRLRVLKNKYETIDQTDASATSVKAMTMRKFNRIRIKQLHKDQTKQIGMEFTQSLRNSIDT